MKQALSFKFDINTAISCLGLAFLWPCLQASGFYPLSVASPTAALNSVIVAQYHVWYSLTLFVSVCITIVLRKKLESFFEQSRWVLLATGVLGSIGHVLLIIASPSSTQFHVQIFTGVLFVALFVAAFLMTWACRIAQGDVRRAIFIIALSFLLSQVILMLYYTTGLTQAYFLMMCPLLGGLCAVFSTAPSHREVNYSVKTLKGLPWSMVIPALFLIYFCVVFVRLSMQSFSGDAALSSKMITAVVGAATFLAIAVYLTTKTEIKNKLIVVFAFLVVIYIIVLSTMLLTGYSETLVRRALVAIEHCFEAFVWMLLVYAAIRKQLSAVLVFSFYAVFAVIIPWMISFDLYYLSDLHLVVPRDYIAAPAITVASLIAAVSTIIFLVSYAFKLGKEAGITKDDWQKAMVTNALAGVEPTPREIEIAVYVYRGYSAKSVAEKLFVSEPTVKSYTTQIYRKLGIHSKQEFISFVDSYRENMTDL